MKYDVEELFTMLLNETVQVCIFFFLIIHVLYFANYNKHRSLVVLLAMRNVIENSSVLSHHLNIILYKSSTVI